MGLLSYLNSLSGGTIVEPNYDNLLRTTARFEASGGTITDSGGYRIHTFTSPGSFVVTS